VFYGSRNADQKSHYGFSALEKEEVWDRWQRGESLKAIRRVFDNPSSSIYFQLSPYGGTGSAQLNRALVGGFDSGAHSRAQSLVAVKRIQSRSGCAGLAGHTGA
jgi:hypothetical protein